MFYRMKYNSGLNPQKFRPEPRVFSEFEMAAKMVTFEELFAFFTKHLGHLNS